MMGGVLTVVTDMGRLHMERGGLRKASAPKS